MGLHVYLQIQCGINISVYVSRMGVCMFVSIYIYACVQVYLYICMCSPELANGFLPLLLYTTFETESSCGPRGQQLGQPTCF